MDIDTFKAQISEGVVIVDFWATWCGPCRTLSPILDALAAKHGLPLLKIDVDERNDLANEYNLLSVPTVMLFRNGVLDRTVIGALPQDAMEKRLGLV